MGLIGRQKEGGLGWTRIGARESCSQLGEKWLAGTVGQSVDCLDGVKNRRFETPKQLKTDRRVGQDCHWARVSDSPVQDCQLYIILSRYYAVMSDELSPLDNIIACDRKMLRTSNFIDS